MNFSALNKKLVVGGLLAAMTLSAIAPAAYAGNGRGRGNHKYRRGEVRYSQPSYSYYPTRRVAYRSYPTRVHSYPTRVYHRGSGAAPVIAGFIGGLAIGAILGSSHAQPAYAQPYRYDDRDVYYVDPYADRSYASLSVYVSNTERCEHPRLVRVIDRRSNHCVRTIRYSDGGWQDCGRGNGGYDDGYFDRYGHDRDGGRYDDRDGRYDDRDGRYDDRYDDEDYEN